MVCSATKTTEKTMNEPSIESARQQHDAIDCFAKAEGAEGFLAAVQNLAPLLDDMIHEGRKAGLQDKAMHLLAQVAIAPDVSSHADPGLQKSILEALLIRTWHELAANLPHHKQILLHALPIMQEAIHQKTVGQPQQNVATKALEFSSLS
jgi:hypothetical protein